MTLDAYEWWLIGFVLGVPALSVAILWRILRVAQINTSPKDVKGAQSRP